MPKFYFPTQEERKNLIRQLEEMAANGNPPEDKRLFEEYLKALKKLDEQMNALTESGEDGLPPLLSAEDTEKLLEGIEETAKMGEVFLANAEVRKQMAEPVPSLVGQMQHILSGNFEALQSYDPAKPTSLPELLEKSKAITIDLRGRNLKTVGNLTSSRIPMTIVDAQGNKRAGFFTKASHFHIKDDFKKIINQAKQSCTEQGKQELDNLLINFNMHLMNTKMKKFDGKRIGTDNVSEEFLIASFMNLLHDHALPADQRDGTAHVNVTVKTSTLKSFMKNIGVNTKNLSSQALGVLAKGFEKMSNAPALSIMGAQLELRDGARLDCRNTGMSQMATLLGVPNLIARSENVRMIDENGQVIEGSFMDQANGFDLFANRKQMSYLSHSPMSDPKARNTLFKSIADLQVLDYLCLNEDRHPGNLFYQIDKDGNLIGVQGIDNDTSFGERLQSAKMTQDLKVISRSMSEKIMNLNANMLSFALRGSGLKKGEINCTISRLLQLQRGITSKKVKIVDDNKMCDLTKAQRYSTGADPNLFKYTETFINTNLPAAHAQYGRQPLPEVPAVPNYAQVTTTDRRYTIGSLRDAINDASRLVEDKENKFRMKDLVGIRGKSQNFKDLMDAVKKTAALQETVFGSKDVSSQLTANDGVNLNNTSTHSLQSQIDESFTQMELQANKYLLQKCVERKAQTFATLQGKNSYEQKHIDYAMKILSTVEEYRKKTAAPETEADIKALHAQEDLKLLTDLRTAKEATKKVQEQQQLMV